MLSIYLVIGAFAGIMSGLFGVGGGVVVIPALSAIFLHHKDIPEEYRMQMAIGTSLAIVIVTAASALYAHSKRGVVQWGMVKNMLPGLLAGAILGAVVDFFLPSKYLQIIFGLFLLIIGLRMVFNRQVREGQKGLSLPIIRVASFLIGIFSSLLGVGGGTLLLPFLLRCRLDMLEATGTSVACGLVVGVVATLCFMMSGLISMVHGPLSTGYIFWPAFFGVAVASTLFAPLGARLAHVLPKEVLQRFFGLFLLLTAADMLFFK